MERALHYRIRDLHAPTVPFLLDLIYSLALKFVSRTTCVHPFLLLRFHGAQVGFEAAAAPGFIHSRSADHDQVFTANQTLRVLGRIAVTSNKIWDKGDNRP